MCNEEKAFQEALDRDPSDHTTRLVFADWLEERGDERAEGHRALASRGINCYFVGGYHTFADFNVPVDGDCSALPADWWKMTKRHRSHIGVTVCSDGEWTGWLSRQDAEDTAALAFARLPESRRAELLGTVAGVA